MHTPCHTPSPYTRLGRRLLCTDDCAARALTAHLHALGREARLRQQRLELRGIVEETHPSDQARRRAAAAAAERAAAAAARA